MISPIRLAVRLTALAALFAALQFLAAPPAGLTPYTSALLSLGPAAALAAPGCNSKACSKEPGRKSPTCIQAPVNYNCSASMGVCTLTPC